MSRIFSLAFASERDKDSYMYLLYMKKHLESSAYLYFLVRLMTSQDECDDVCCKRKYSMPDIVLIFEKKWTE